MAMTQDEMYEKERQIWSFLEYFYPGPVEGILHGIEIFQSNFYRGVSLNGGTPFLVGKPNGFWVAPF